MKKYLLLFSLIVLTPLSLFACDICSCGVGSYYLGILPEFNQKFAGLRYQHKTLQTHLGPNGERTVLTADETYQSIEAWGGWNVNERWRVMAIVPYNFNQRHISSEDADGKKNGLGDVVAMGYYKVLEKRHTTSSSKLFVHSLWAGAGVKAPTGEYDTEVQDEVASGALNTFQLGTASTDFLLNLAYDARLMDLGLNVNANYKINTINPHDYRYGNKFTVNMLAYYKFIVKGKFRIAPNIGAMYETQQQDELDGKFYVSQSGGNVLTGIAGVEFNLGRLSFGGNFQNPLSQNLAGDRAYAGDRFMTHISVGF